MDIADMTVGIRSYAMDQWLSSDEAALSPEDLASKRQTSGDHSLRHFRHFRHLTAVIEPSGYLELRPAFRNRETPFPVGVQQKAREEQT
jgi:hypothetical protein